MKTGADTLKDFLKRARSGISFSLIAVMLLESVALSTVAPARVAYAVDDPDSGDQCATLTPEQIAAGRDALNCVPASKADRKAARLAAANCASNPTHACYKTQIDKMMQGSRDPGNAQTGALALLRVAISASSDDIKFATESACKNYGGASQGPAHKFLSQILCVNTVLSGLRNDASQLANRNGVTQKNFEDFLQEQGEKHPPNWSYLLFNKVCAGAKATYACFHEHISQVARDAAVAAPAYTAYAGQVYRANILSAKDCPYNASGCTPQFKSSDALIPVDKHPAYVPRRPPPPPPPANGGGGGSGSGGSGNQGNGTGGGGDSARAVAGPGHGLSENGGAGTGDGSSSVTRPGSPAGYGNGAPPKGARDGVKGGSRDCGTDEKGNPVDCNSQSLIQLSDPSWDVPGPMAQCPAFLAPYNCLGSGSGLAGDLTNIRNAPYFTASREKMCRERIKNIFGPGAVSNKHWPDPSQATLSNSPGCDYWISQLHMPDPVPPLTREQIDTARVSGQGELYDDLMNIADIASQNGLQRDMGAYSVEQKAIALFQVSVNLNQGILVDADPSAYNSTVSELLGAASCLSPQDQTVLRSQLQVARDVGLTHSALFKSTKDDLDKKWIEGLGAQAEKVTLQDRSSFDLGHLWGRMRCDQAAFGDPSQCLKVDYRNIATPGPNVSQQVYESRLRWIKNDLAHAVAPDGTETDSRYDSILRPGSGANEDPSCTYVSCSGLGNAVRDVRKQANAIGSDNPLLEEPTGRTELRPECGADPAERNIGTVRWEAVTSPFHTPYEESACQRKQTLADVLNANKDPLVRLSYAHNAVRQLHDESLQKIRDICAKPGGLSEEGKHASGVEQLAQGFMKCQDVGEYSAACTDRRSFGWAMCRNYLQNVADGNTRQFHEMFQGMAMAAGGALAIIATAGGAAAFAGVIGIGMSATSIIMRHQEIADSKDNYESARSDFMAKLGDREATRAAWNRMGDAQRYAVAGDVFDVATSLLDVHSISGALKTASVASAAKRVAMVDALIQDDKALDALAHARKLRGAEQTLAEVERVGGAEARLELLADMRGGLRRYGPIVETMPEGELTTLQNLESRLRTLQREGMIDEAAVTRARRLISDALVSPEKLNQLAGHEMADLYLEMNASGRFTGTAGRVMQDRFLEVAEGMIRQQHPEITEELWAAMSRDDKLAVLEGRMTPSDALAHHPELAKKAKFATSPVPEVRGGRVSSPPLSNADAMSVNATAAVGKLRERYRVFSSVSEHDNAWYIAISNSEAGHGRLYFEAENAVLKQLNDTVIANKDTVTAITNQYKEMLFKNIESDPLLRGKLMAQYSDFKSMRLIFTENTKEIAEALQKVYQETGKEFDAAMADSPLKDLYAKAHGISGTPGSWHMAGIGGTADEASVAARSARPYFKAGQSLTPMRSFAASTGMLADRLAAMEDLRSGLQVEAAGKSGKMLVPAVPGSSKLVLSESAFDILRKVKAKGLDDYVAQVQGQFMSRFGVHLTAEQVINIRDYASLVDGYTASIISSERVVIDMSRADKFGVMTFDLTGAGAANFERTAGELAAGSGGTPSQAVVGARKAEKVVTGVMKEKLAAIREAVGEVMGEDAILPDASAGKKPLDPFGVTGDDVNYFFKRHPTPAEREAIQSATDRNMAKRGFGSDRVRPTYQPPQGVAGFVIPAGERSTYIVAAEKVEKDLRRTLELGRKVSYDALEKVGIMVDYTPAAGGGVMRILLTGRVDPATLEQIRAQAAAVVPKGVHFEGVSVAPGSMMSAPADVAPHGALLDLTWVARLA